MSEVKERTIVDQVAHDEQLQIWAHDLHVSLGLGDWLKETGSYADGVDLERTLRAEIKEIIESALGLAQPDSGGWLPIDSAPKDEFILLSDGSDVYAGMWIDEAWRFAHDQSPVHANLADGHDRYSIELTWSTNPERYGPVFWMPLPPPPAQGDDG
ncbi:MAG: hypothetical protein MRY72_10515 [Aquisalinus sp.]|nr:hypothetical protein [Aquisalinus sp.]